MTNKNEVAAPLIDTVDVAIANAASLSASIDMGHMRLCGIQMPAAWTTAGLSFQASLDNSTFTNMYDAAGNEYIVSADISRYIPLDMYAFAGFRYIKIRSGTGTVPVVQGGARTIKASLAKVLR